MRIACFCSEVYEAEDLPASCPRCGAMALGSRPTERELAEMETDLDLVLADHEPVREPPHGL